MFTGNAGHVGALSIATTVFAVAAILRGGAAAADPSQDDKFLALLEQKDIPALENIPSLIAEAHKDCRQLDGGMSAHDLVAEMRNDAYDVDPVERQYPVDRLTRTMVRFITAAVEAYCPYDQGKIASIMAERVAGADESVFRLSAYASDGVYGARGPALVSLIRPVPSGEITDPNPPQIPPSPPPVAHIRTPHQPVAAPPRPRQTPPPPQQPPPPPPQVEPPPPQAPPPPPPPPPQVQPPAAGPQPGTGGGGSGNGGGSDGIGGGSAGGSGGSGGGGGGGPAKPPPEPTPQMPPGFVRLAP